MSRGRPSEVPPEIREKFILECFDVPSKPEIGSKTTFYYDRSKSTKGAWKVENVEPKGYKHPTVKVDRKKPYIKQPIVMVFASSNRSNAKTKMKIWNNENIDYIISAKKLPGVPDKAIILELGIGVSLIEKYKLKYKLK